MFEGFFTVLFLVGGIVLLAMVVRQNARIALIERELGALRSFVLSAPVPAAQPVSAPAAGPEAPAARAEPAPPEKTAAAAQPATASEPTKPALAPPEQAAAEKAAEPAKPFRWPPALARDASRDESAAIETALGTRWAVWVGGLALALGGVFLVRYSIEAGFFGPAARLTLAALFGAALLALGEFLRRTGYRLPLEGLANAYIPAVLTAAGAFSLFGTVYAAHALYGFIGTGAAFVLLGAIGVATIALALLHGQALAGVGLLGALATPLLVASAAPNPWALFGYLAIVLVATVAVARTRRWLPLAAAAFAGTGLWSLLYLLEAGEPRTAVVLFIGLVQLGALALVWLARTDTAPDTNDTLPAAIVAGSVGIGALALLVLPDLADQSGPLLGTALIAAMLAAAAFRGGAVPLVFGAGIAAVAAFARIAFAGTFRVAAFGESAWIGGFPDLPMTGTLDRVGWVLGVLFLAVGLWQARGLAAARPREALVWSGFAALVSNVALFSLWFAHGDLNRDLMHGLAALLLAAILAAGAEWIARAEAKPLTGGAPVSAALAGSGAAAVLAAHMTLSPGWTTIGIGLLALVPALATRRRSYPALGALSVAAAVVTLARVAIDPSIFGADALSPTPVFNALLPGYGLPALAFGIAAWQLRRTTGGRAQLAMEAAAALFGLLTLAVLVRHAMNGGRLGGGAPSLGEQALYSLMALGAGGILVALDGRAASPVFRAGSIGLGLLSATMIALQHLLLLDPLFTNESTGRIPLFNLLFLAYLLPGLAAGALALYARSRRPPWYSATLALTAALLAFAYASLSLRRLFKGEFIGVWSGFSQLETYSYSALWLAMGVLLLIVGVALSSTVLRLASGALISVAVAKVFLFDMSELQGVLRALSFIGLGAVLIGIGLFYQRLLTRSRRPLRDESGGPPR